MNQGSATKPVKDRSGPVAATTPRWCFSAIYYPSLCGSGPPIRFNLRTITRSWSGLSFRNDGNCYPAVVSCSQGRLHPSISVISFLPVKVVFRAEICREWNVAPFHNPPRPRNARIMFSLRIDHHIGRETGISSPSTPQRSSPISLNLESLMRWRPIQYCTCSYIPKSLRFDRVICAVQPPPAPGRSSGP